LLKAIRTSSHNIEQQKSWAGWKIILLAASQNIAFQPIPVLLYAQRFLGGVKDGEECRRIIDIFI